MEFYEVIDKRRSIRQFEDREIPREVLERILNAGLKAPSSNHQRRWELVTLTDKAMILELAKLIRPYPCRIQEPKITARPGRWWRTCFSPPPPRDWVPSSISRSKKSLSRSKNF